MFQGPPGGAEELGEAERLMEIVQAFWGGFLQNLFVVAVSGPIGWDSKIGGNLQAFWGGFLRSLFEGLMDVSGPTGWG